MNNEESRMIARWSPFAISTVSQARRVCERMRDRRWTQNDVTRESAWAGHGGCDSVKRTEAVVDLEREDLPGAVR